MISLWKLVVSLLFLGIFLIQVVDARLGETARKRNLQDTSQPLVIAGNNGVPEERFPLRLCEGDCDNDSQCGEGLKCFQRESFEPVPGCVGDLTSQTDYCVIGTGEPTQGPTEMLKTEVPSSSPSVAASNAPTIDKPEELIVTGAPTEGPTKATTTFSPTTSPVQVIVTAAPTAAMTEAATTGAPSGAPTEAAVTAAPTEAASMAPTEAATTGAPTEGATMAVTEAATTGAPDADPVMDPTTITPSTIVPTTVETTSASTEVPTGAPTGLDDLTVNVPATPDDGFPLLTVGNDGNFQAYPLSVCHGDCDVDEDCAGDLICLQRIMDEPVPGCYGTGDFSIDYCIQPVSILSSIFEPQGVAAGGAVEMVGKPSGVQEAAAATVNPTTIAPTMAETVAATMGATVAETVAETPLPALLSAFEKEADEGGVVSGGVVAGGEVNTGAGTSSSSDGAVDQDFFF